MQKDLALHRAIINSCLDGILVVDHESGKVSEFNQHFLEMWKIPKEISDRGTNDGLIEFVLNQLVDPPGFIKLVRELEANPAKKSYDQLTFKDGRIFARYSEALFVDDLPVARVWYFRDITEKVHVDRAIEERSAQLAKSEAFLDHALSAIPSLVAYFDRQEVYCYVNATFEKWFGHTSKESLGKHLAEVVGPVAYAERKPYVERALAGETVRFEGFLPYRGELRTVLATYTPDIDASGKVLGFFAVVHDVSDIKAMEQAAISRELELRALFESLSEGVFIHDATGKVIFANPAAEQIIGLAKSEIMGQNSSYPKWQSIKEDLTPFDPSERASALVLRTGKAVNRQVMGLKLPSGLKWISVNAVPLFLEGQSKPHRVILTFHDITLQRETSAALKSANEKLGIVVSAVQFGIWDMDMVTGNLLWDDFHYELYGVKRSQFPNPTDVTVAFLEPEEKARLYREAEETVRRRETVSRQSFKVRLPDGTLKHLSSCSSFLYDRDGKATRVIGATWDVTESVTRSQEIEQQRIQLVASSKMSSLGEMAGGIAHEINNPLAIILGHLSRVRGAMNDAVLDKAKVFQLIEKAEATSFRISKIIKGLRSFSRNSEADTMVEVPVSQLIDDTLELCRERFRNHGVELRIEVEKELHVECRSTQISQIIMNLLNNAHDAVECLPEKWVELKVTAHQGGKVQFIVTDAGAGISADVVAKMMQPFFTTKDVGKGTGLGLSISKGISEDHHGGLIYDSASAHTRFVLELPTKQPVKKDAPALAA